MTTCKMNRRNFIRGATASTIMAAAGAVAEGKPQIQRREIPGTGNFLPVVGLGNSNAFRQGDVAVSERILRTLVEHGGAYVDCSGSSRFLVAEQIARLGLADDVFMGTYFSAADPAEARADARNLLAATGKPQLELMHGYPEDAVPNWDQFRAWKEEGISRYIGLARHQQRYYESMMKVMATDTVDFLQVNYSLLETEAEKQILPMAMDRNVAVTINRPFINGAYFDVVRGQQLPDWAAEFDCASWAQFSLKFILSHPAVNCVLTETANPKHLSDNLGAGTGQLPDSKMRARMLSHIRDIA